jgi:hypothetical protein
MFARGETLPLLIEHRLVEVLGYIGRAQSAKQSPNWTLGPYIMQSLLLLLAPTLFAASIYMILGRIIRLTEGEEHSLIRAKWLTKVFVLGDVLSFLTQSGGLFRSNSNSDLNGTRTDDSHRWWYDVKC